MPLNDSKDWTAAIADRLGRDFTALERKQLAAVTELFEELAWRDSLYAKDLEILAPDIKQKVADPAKPLSDGLWTEKPATELKLLSYLAYLIESHGLPIPEFFRPFADTAPIRQAILQRSQVKEARLWRNRLSNLSQTRLPREAPALSVRLKLQGRSLRWEGRSDPQAPFEPISAKDFGQWLAKDFGFLERFAPDSIPLCALFQEYHKFSQRARLDLEKEEDCAFLNKLLHHPATRDRIVAREDEPLSVSKESLRWTGVADGLDATACYELRLELDTGEPAPFPLAYLPGERPLYLAGDALYRGPSLLRASESPNQAFKIPADAMEAPEGLLFLRNHGLPLPARVGDKVVVIPLKARLYCAIRNEESASWEKRRFLDCRLAAVSPDHKYWFLLAEEGWESSPNLETGDESPEVEEGSLFEYPPTNYVETVLEPFGLKEQEDAGTWSRAIEPDFPRLFVAWLDDMPDAIQLVPDEELDTLVDGRPAGRYALAINASEHEDWFNLKLDPEFLDTSLSEAERELVLRAKGDFAYLPGKGWKRFEPNVSGQDEALLDSLGLAFDEAKEESHSLHALQLAEARLDDQAYDELRKSIQKRAKELTAKTPTNLPKGIRSELRPYQIDGFKFLAFLSRNRFGGVLADDMGLGKTLQTLTWLTWLKLNRPAEEPFQILVVCPKSVMHVWESEVERHATMLTIATFDPERYSTAAWQTAGIDILVANYSQLRIQRDFFVKQDWTACVLDEAQFIKNSQSQTARVARELKATHRIALTGTPVENRAADLWSIFAYAMPGLLGSRTSFARQYRETDPKTPQRLANRVRHFMIRRSKKQVATDLPDRIEETLLCELEGEQKDLYMAELKLAQQRVLDIDSNASFDKERFNILASLLRLRQICCHPRLIDGAYADVKSAKLEALLEHVTELRDEGHKVLIFSQFVEMLNIISESLQEIEIPHLMLTGQTKNRQELIEQFQNDESQTVFLLSLRAAGFGLNLTAASYVIMYDPWWNPAVEAQAIDRAHRIGQKNTVNAYRLIAKDSVEQRIQSLQYKKEALANEIVREESLSQILDLDNLRYVLGG